MSSVELTDENCVVVVHGGKHSTMSEDIFAVAQPTGRPSILRQTENLPNNTVPKGMKVCFQTPRRDPVTKRIMSPTKMSKMTSVAECAKALESLKLDKSNTTSIQDVTEQAVETKLVVSSYPDDQMLIQSKGGYQFDFDNLDAMNPFQCSNKMAMSPVIPACETPPPFQKDPFQKSPNLTKVESALDETLPFTPSVDNSLNATADISSTESSVVSVVKVPEVGQLDSGTATPNTKQCECQDKPTEDSPLPDKGSYTFDFDNLDAVNPFQTGGSKIPNSPHSCQHSPPEKDVLAVTEVTPTSPIPVQEPVIQPEVKPVAAVTPISASRSVEQESQPSTCPLKEGPVKLEFSFDDNTGVKAKPPPKKLGVKRPTGQKAKEVKPVHKAIPQKEPEQPTEEAPVPKGAYSFDFDKFDDPNFNPFGSKSAISDSPKCGVKTSPEAVKTSLEKVEEPKEVISVECNKDNEPVSKPSPKETVSPNAACDMSFPPEAEHMSFSEKKSQGSLLDEEFVPGTTFLANDFEGQIDYLEQFGSSSFKESALRKQSLYLKFDPLLRDSPKKPSGAAVLAPVHRPSTLSSRLETQMAEKATSEPQNDDFKLLDVGTEPSAPVLESPVLPVPRVPQPSSTEDAIIDVLKYSQKDMDAAIARVQAEAEEREMQWSTKYNELIDDGQEMRKIMAEYELMIAKMMADQEKEREVAQAKLREALEEKDQVSSDLNTMERSFSDLFKRLEKYKSIIEGYKKNEETLKTCAQDYLARIKKEEQRYQALKAHAEEKITQANAEISDVRSKYKAEGSVLQAQLKREQLKVQSLEKNMDQKEKDIEELTKLCDELIKVQKGGSL